MTKDTKKKQDMPGKRRRSRILALQTLYACEVGEFSQWQIMLERITENGRQATTVVNYARELLSELYKSIESIDSLIRKRAENWDIKRMSAIDRNILRLATTELCYFKQVPAKVVIDEAVELAKSFGTEESGKFVNGIIDSIHKNLKNNFNSASSGKEVSTHGTAACSK